MLGRSGDIYAGASERLADGECRGIDLRFEGDLAPVEAFRDNAGSHMTQRWRGESGANSSRAAGPTPPIKGRFHRRSDEFLESIKKGVETRMSFRRRSDPFPGPRVKPGEGV